MTREEAKQLLPIIQAYAEGKQIQQLSNKWRDNNELSINCLLNNPELYRIKPKPKYRPYYNLKECFCDMKNHEPFGYIRQKQKGNLELIIGTLDDEYEYLKLSMWNTTKLKTVFERYTYFDGSPFGVKEEE